MARQSLPSWLSARTVAGRQELPNPRHCVIAIPQGANINQPSTARFASLLRYKQPQLSIRETSPFSYVTLPASRKQIYQASSSLRTRLPSSFYPIARYISSRSPADKTNSSPASSRTEQGSTTPEHQSVSLHETVYESNTMASDDAYASFLDKANADPSAGVQKSSDSSGGFHSTKTVDDGQKLPKALKDVDAFYISDSDESFEPVALDWEDAGKGKWPTTAQFKSLILPSSDKASDLEASTLSESKFDPRNQYTKVFDSIRTAISGSDKSDAEIKIYRIQYDNTRAEYWVVGLDKDEKRLVGLKAKAVES